MAITSAALSLFRDSAVLRCLVLIVIAEFAAAGVTGTGYTLLSSQKGWDATEMGFVLSSYGAGAVVSSLAVAVVQPKKTTAWIGGATAVCGLAFGVSGLLWLPAACCAALVAGIGGGAASTLLLARYLSRMGEGPVATALSVMNLAAFGMTSLSYVLFGAVSSSASPAGAFAVFGCVLAVAGVAFWRSFAKSQTGKLVNTIS